MIPDQPTEPPRRDDAPPEGAATYAAARRETYHGQIDRTLTYREAVAARLADPREEG